MNASVTIDGRTVEADLFPPGAEVPPGPPSEPPAVGVPTALELSPGTRIIVELLLAIGRAYLSAKYR